MVPLSQTIALPDDLDDVRAAAIANPGMSSWAALTNRAHIKVGEAVLVNGATGASGRLAVRIARHLGAARVIATGRNVDILGQLGADETISLGDDADDLEQRFKAAFATGVDIVIDYLWGMSAERLLIAAAKAGPEGSALRVVQVGNASGANISLPGAVLRSSTIELMGSGIGSVSLTGLMEAIQGMFAAAGAADLQIPLQQAPLAQVERLWAADAAERMVFVP